MTSHEQRKVIVVGAASGIGAATAAHFSARGDYVLAVDYQPYEGPAAAYHVCDLREPVAITAMLDVLPPGWDLLAHVAGVPGTAPPRDVLAVNYLGMRLVTQGCLPLLRPGGAIVAVASTAGMAWQQRESELTDLLEATTIEEIDRWIASCDLSYPIYSTSKEAMISFARRLSGPAWAKYGVRVNTVSPGPVNTPIFSDFEHTMGKDVLETLRTTVGRHAEVEDVVPVIDFLGSPQARWINGQDIEVDGGFLTSALSKPISV